MHGLLAAALFASALPSYALAQGSDTPPSAANAPSGAASDIDTAAGDEGLGALPLPPVTFSAFADLAQGYSTNSQGRSGGSDGDTFTRGRVGFLLHYDKQRLQADASYNLTGEYWSKFHNLNHLSQRLALDSRLTGIPEMLFVSANAFAAPTELTRVGALSAGGEPISRYNTSDTYGYSVRPEFLLRFDDYATSSLLASHGGVFFVRPSTDTTGTPPPITPAQNAYSTTVMEQVTSGTYFDRLQWSLTGSYGQFSQTTRTERQEEGLANLTYALTRPFKVFAIGGYSEYKSTVALTKNLSGPTALGGFSYTLGTDFYVTAEAGTQHNFPTYMGSARWSITPLTMFVAQATDEITTPQGDILNQLGQMGALGGGAGGSDAFGGYGNIGGGLGLGSFGGFSPYGSHGLSLDNSIYRIRNVDGSLIHTADRMQYTLSLFGTERDRLDVVTNPQYPARTSVYGVRGAVSRKFSEYLSGMVAAAYSRGNEFGGRDQIVSADANLTYHLSETIDLYLTDHFVHRQSTNLIGAPNGPLTDDQVLIGIRARF